MNRHGLRALAAAIFARELELSNPREDEMYDVYHLSTNKRVWIRYALHRPLSEARRVARAVSLHGCATWIRPHTKVLYDGVVPAGAAQPAAPAPCIGNDPACPCQDGDLCHYKDSPDGRTKAWGS